MLIWPDCIHCMFKMSLSTARLITKDKDQIRELSEQILKLKAFQGKQWNITSPEVISDIWRLISKMSEGNDPLKNVKKGQNDIVLEAYPYVKKSVSESDDPLLEALKFSIAGNSIDIMSTGAKDPQKELVEKLHKLELNPGNIEGFKERLSKAKKLVYIGDNCGEIVFDRLFIETIKEYYDIDVTHVTRKIPVLNDAILSDAVYVGMDKVTRVIDNGIQEPLPGTMLKKISPEFKKLIDAADLIISKGGGNYDSLTEENSLKGKISFLFQAKCEPYTTSYKVALGSLLVDNH